MRPSYLLLRTEKEVSMKAQKKQHGRLALEDAIANGLPQTEHTFRKPEITNLSSIDCVMKAWQQLLKSTSCGSRHPQSPASPFHVLSVATVCLVFVCSLVSVWLWYRSTRVMASKVSCVLASDTVWCVFFQSSSRGTIEQDAPWSATDACVTGAMLWMIAVVEYEGRKNTMLRKTRSRGDKRLQDSDLTTVITASRLLNGLHRSYPHHHSSFTKLWPSHSIDLAISREAPSRRWNHRSGQSWTLKHTQGHSNGCVVIAATLVRHLERIGTTHNAIREERRVAAHSVQHPWSQKVHWSVMTWLALFSKMILTQRADFAPPRPISRSLALLKVSSRSPYLPKNIAMTSD